MGKPSTGAPATGWARWVIAASIAMLLAAAVATILAGDDDTAITRAGTSTTTAPTEQLDASSSTAAPSGEAAPAEEQVPAPTTTAAAPAPPSTSAAAAPPAPTDHAVPLRDRTFESVSVVEGATERTFTDGGTVRVQFERAPAGDVIRWRISCNTGGGDVTVSADRLTIEMTGSSAMSCGEARDADDSWISAFFGTDPGWALDGSRLVLRSGDTVITLDEVPAERFGSS